jgi:indole-3-glycerol phosphate synthase
MAQIKKAPVKGSIAKTFDPKKLVSKMTAQDAAMLKLLKKKYGAEVYKG